MSLSKSTNSNKTKEVKELSPRQEVKKQKRAAFYNKAQLTLIKLGCALLLVAFAYNGCVNLIQHFLRSNVSDYVPSIIAIVVVAVLAIKLAACDKRPG